MYLKTLYGIEIGKVIRIILTDEIFDRLKTLEKYISSIDKSILNKNEIFKGITMVYGDGESPYELIVGSKYGPVTRYEHNNIIVDTTIDININDKSHIILDGWDTDQYFETDSCIDDFTDIYFSSDFLEAWWGEIMYNDDHIVSDFIKFMPKNYVEELKNQYRERLGWADKEIINDY